jgi:hypothetical protein
MSTTTQFRLFFLAAFIILFCAMITAQVKIKERVEIAPGKLLKGTTDENAMSITIPGLNLNDFVLQGGSFINPYNQIYDDHIFVPRIGGVIKTAWDILYSYNGFEIQNGLQPWEDRLLVFGPDGKVRYKYNVGEFWDDDGKWIAYYFDQERYWYDRKMDSLCQAQVPEHHPDTTKWGWVLNLNLEIPVTAWEPLRFRLFYGPDEIATAPSMMFVTTGTNYPSEFTGGMGNMTFPCTSNLCNNMFGDIFNMCFYIDSNKVGNTPIVYPDQAEFFLPDSGMYRVIIGGVLPNVNGTLSIIDTTSHVLVSDIRNHQTDTILVGPYSEGTIIKFDLSGMAQGQGSTDYNGGAVVFESWTDYDFRDAAIWFEYAAGRPDHLELWSNTETIYYGDTIDVDVVPCDKDSLFSPLGRDCYYEFSVELTGETSKYVELIYDDVGSNIVEHIPSENRKGLGVRLAANKLEPDSVVDLTFHLKAIDLQGGGAACSINPTPTQPTRMAKLSKDIHIKMKSGDTSIKNIVDQKISESIASKVKLGQKKENGFNSKPAVYRKKKIGHLISRQGSSSTNQTSKLIQVKDASTNEIRYSITDGEAGNVILENEWGMGINPPQEILLGETIYFQAVKDPIQTPNHEKNIIIVPLKKLSDKIATTLQDAKFTVSRFKGDEDKLGVYYDTKIDSDGTNLEPGIIRLVGRYWKPGDGNEYIVKLEASTWDRYGHMYVQVKKPIVLGDPSLTDENRHTKVKDVLGNDLWLDEWIIKYAGEYGIFPQIIKAQIQCESNFKPAYRWEPFKDAEEQREGNFKGSRYKITLDPRSEGNPPIPWEDHKNARPIYPHGEYMTIWDRFYNNSTWLNPSASSNTYDGKRSNGEYIWSIDDADGWESKFLKAISNIENSVDDARTLANKWLHDKYRKIDQTAQTRIVASYGFLQMLYTSAVYLRNYHKDLMNGTCYAHLPEYLNETENNFNYAIPYLASILSNVIKELSDKDGNWPLGYEAKMKIALNSYNGRKDRNSYGKNVLNVRNIYYPNLNITR